MSNESIELHERVARLETSMTALRADVAATRQAAAATREDVASIRSTVNGYRGFWRGVLTVFSFLGAALGAGIAAFWQWVTK